MQKIVHEDKHMIGYDVDRLISVLEFGHDTKIQYIIKTFLNLMYHNDDIEIHVLKKVEE